MSKYGGRPSGRKWDTPTDAISRKVFDRHKDQMVRRHVDCMERIRALEGQIKRLVAELLREE